MPAKHPPDLPPQLESLFNKAKQAADSYCQHTSELSDLIVAFEQRLIGLPGKVAVRVDAQSDKPNATDWMPLRLTFKRANDGWALLVDDARRPAEPLDHRANEAADHLQPSAPVAPAAPVLTTGRSKPAPAPAFVLPGERKLTDAPLPVKMQAVELFPSLLAAFIEASEKALTGVRQAITLVTKLGITKPDSQK